MNPLSWIRVAEGVLALLILAGAVHLGMVIKQGEWDADVVSKQKGEDAALKAAAEAISHIKVTSEKYIQPLQTEIRTNTVYAECVHSPDSLRNLNALITGEPVDGGSLPASEPAR